MSGKFCIMSNSEMELPKTIDEFLDKYPCGYSNSWRKIIMKDKINLNSQICTTREQSERLLTLGLKKETADMTIHIKNDDDWYVTAEPFYEWGDDMNTIPSLEETEPILPAWSLGRLIEMMLRTAIMHTQEGDTRIDIAIYAIEIVVSDDPIAEAVSVIEWLIKEGNFNKKYLV